MGQQTYKCHCGTEFEDSEFCVTEDCPDCRDADPTPITDNYQNRLNQVTHEMITNIFRRYQPDPMPNNNVWNQTFANTVITGTNTVYTVNTLGGQWGNAQTYTTPIPTRVTPRPIPNDDDLPF